MAKFALIVVLAVLAGVDASGSRAASRSGSMAKAKMGASMKHSMNPIRRIVTMLQDMVKKVEAEGEKDIELHEKFVCYCKSGTAALSKAIEDATTKIPQLESDIKESESTKTQLEEDLVKHKADRVECADAIAKATEIRKKEAGAFGAESGEDKSNLEAMGKAITAIAKGMEGSFLQTNAAVTLQKLSVKLDMSNADRDLMTSFLTQSNNGQAQGSGEILGVLKQMKETMEKDLAEMTAEEDSAKTDFDGVVGAKEKETADATLAIEEKTKRVGEVAVEIVNLKEDLEDTIDGLAQNTKLLQEMEKACALAQKEFETRAKVRQEELIALADTIKMLNDDDAQELLQKAIPSASAFLQLQVSSKEIRDQALHALRSVHRVGGHRDVGLDLLVLTLRGKKVSMDKVVGMIDDMIALLGKEQTDDDDKKAYCESAFDKKDDKKKELTRAVSDLGKVLAEGKDSSEALSAEIKSLEEGIHDLDSEVAGATEQRKQEHEEFVAALASNNAAIELVEKAKKRMNKFYNPSLVQYNAPPKRELSEEERNEQNMAGFLQVRSRTLEFVGKSDEEAGGVLAMMDMLKADVEKEIQEMKFGEKDAQGDYQVMVEDAAAKRAADTKSIEEKVAAKASLEAELVKTTDQQKVEAAELLATIHFIADLHVECDFLTQNFDTRKAARVNEVDALNKAKAVLNGADYSLIQTGHQATLRRGVKA